MSREDVLKYQEECKQAYLEYTPEYILTDRVPDAIWEHPIERPLPPDDHTKILNYGLPPEERKFPLMSKRELAKYEALALSTNPSDMMEYREFVHREWDRRINGVFFYNGHQLEWITGWNYVWCQNWWFAGIDPETNRMGEVRPSFRDAQRDVFYIIHWLMQQRNAAGLIWLSYRRFGKSAIAMFCGLMDTTENPKSRFPIQHKNEKDGQKAFKKFIIDGWKKLPIWFKPIDTGQTSYKDHIVFGSQMKRGVNVEERNYEEVLDSEIFVMDSKEGAVDGDYFTFFVRDEAAKTLKHIDIEEAWNVTREAGFIGARRVGFSILTSTAEDMEKYGSGQFLSLWNASSTKKRLPSGYTESYLYQLFIPAYYGFMDDDDDENDDLIDASKKFIDEWGYSNVEVCKKYHLDIYASLDGNALLSRKRKFPVTFNDAWLRGDMKNTFPITKLIEQKIYNDQKKNYIRGNFEWMDGMKDSMVIWRPDSDGKWLMLSTWMTNENDRNKYEQKGTRKFPSRQGVYIGVDPFSHSVTVEHGSMGAAVTVVKYDPYAPSVKEAVVCMYHYREKEPHLFAEDVLMQAVFMSAQILPERNTYGFIDHFRKRGYEGYLMKDPLEKDPKKLLASDYGFPNNDNEKREALMTITGSYMKDMLGEREDGGYGICPFNDLLDQCINFEVGDWKKYDLVVAFMLAVTAMRAVREVNNDMGFSPSDWISGLPTRTEHELRLIKQAITAN